MSDHEDIENAAKRVEKALELARGLTNDPRSRAFPAEKTRDVARMILREANIRKGFLTPKDYCGTEW
jgi:hypothetical protein